MPVEFRYPTVSAPTTSWVPSKQSAPGAGEDLDYPDQQVIKVGNGDIFVQDQGVKEETFTLDFVGLTTVDRDNYVIFFKAVKKAFRTFEFVDRNAVTRTVRIMSPVNFRETFYTADGTGWWDGSIDLREE